MLKSFNQGSDAAVPFCALLEASDGVLYGTTVTGGSENAGAVFKLNKDGSAYAVLRSFAVTNGQGPYGGLVEGSDGALYGSTYLGGASKLGTVFKLKKDGSDLTVLHSFMGGSDGKNPRGALIRGRGGLL